MKRPASARAAAKAKGKTTTKDIGNGNDKGKGNGKGEKGNGNGNGKIDDDAAARAAIRAEADAIGESDIEAIMFEARTREAMMFELDRHLLHSSYDGDYALPRAAAAASRARRLSMELDSRDRNAD